MKQKGYIRCFIRELLFVIFPSHSVVYLE